MSVPPLPPPPPVEQSPGLMFQADDGNTLEFPDSKEFRNVDIIIVGSGPIGATMAYECVMAGMKVLMVETGDQESKHPGEHKKNAVDYQKDIDRFVNVIKAALSPCSVPPNKSYVATLDQISFMQDAKEFVRNGQNPEQLPYLNLPAEAVTRVVGGMASHWTCACPRLCPDIERPTCFDDKEWDRLYTKAEHLIGVSSHEFDDTVYKDGKWASIRHKLVLDNLNNAGIGRDFIPLPLAAHRVQTTGWMDWHSAYTVLRGGQIDETIEGSIVDTHKDLFTLLPYHLCRRVLSHPERDDEVAGVELFSLKKNRSFGVFSSFVFVAGGAVLTPQLLVNSGLSPYRGDDDKEQWKIPSLGEYITEQTMTFCQVVLKESLINKIRSKDEGYPDWWVNKVAAHTTVFPKDPIPLPFNDGEPQVTTKFSKKYPYHTQIHRDAFSYGAVAAAIDSRLIVDFRFFGYTEPNKSNWLKFEKEYKDAYGMPQPTFNFVMSEDDRVRSHEMMAEMCQISSVLGGFLPGSEPQFMAPGLALHLAGTYRVGKDKSDSTIDSNGKVHALKNLFLGGNGVIPTGFGANPTLTSIAFALKASEKIIADWKAKRDPGTKLEPVEKGHWQPTAKPTA